MDLRVGFGTRQTAGESARLTSFPTVRPLHAFHVGAAARRWVFRSVRSGNRVSTLAGSKYSPALEAAIRSGQMIDEKEFGLCKGLTVENTAQSLELARSMRLASSGQ